MECYRCAAVLKETFRLWNIPNNSVSHCWVLTFESKGFPGHRPLHGKQMLLNQRNRNGFFGDWLLPPEKKQPVLELLARQNFFLPLSTSLLGKRKVHLCVARTPWQLQSGVLTLSLFLLNFNQISWQWRICKRNYIWAFSCWQYADSKWIKGNSKQNKQFRHRKKRICVSVSIFTAFSHSRETPDGLPIFAVSRHFANQIVALFFPCFESFCQLFKSLISLWWDIQVVMILFSKCFPQGLWWRKKHKRPGRQKEVLPNSWVADSSSSEADSFGTVVDLLCDFFSSFLQLVSFTWNSSHSAFSISQACTNCSYAKRIEKKTQIGVLSGW